MTGLGWQTGDRQDQDVNPDLSDASPPLFHQLRSRVGSEADAWGRGGGGVAALRSEKHWLGLIHGWARRDDLGQFQAAREFQSSLHPLLFRAVHL